MPHGLARAGRLAATPRLKRGLAVVAHGSTPPTGTAPPPPNPTALLKKRAPGRFRASPSYY